MKNFLKYIWLFVLLMTLVLSFAACGDEPPEETPEEPGTDGPGTEPGTDPEPLTEVVIFQNGKDPNKYSIIYPKGDQASLDTAVRIGRIFRSVTGILPNPKADEDTPVGEYEILIGKTNRPVSTALATDVDAMEEEHKWGFRISGSSLAIYAAGSLAWDRCCTYLQDTLIVNKKDLILSTTFAYTGCITAAELEEIRREEEANIAAQIATLKAKIEQLPLSNFYGCEKRYSWDEVKDEVATTGTYTREYTVTTVIDMTETLAQQSYSAPSILDSPSVGQHPRLLFTAEDIPAIRAAMEDPLCAEAMATLMADVQSDIDGVLTTLKYQEPVALRESGQNEFLNYNGTILGKIQAKAFWYAVTGEQLYGYEAILCMFNYLDTLDIAYRSTDQCRFYGYSAYFAALVYDWCYDLMTPDVREKLVLGIQNACYVGYSSLPDGHQGRGAKTEVGFPPTGGSGPVEGHGCERELLCDLLAVSVAIFDEHPDWYYLVGGRIFAQYIPIRNYYYESAAIYPGGIGNYAPFRYSCDEYCAWIMTVALGKNPFSPAMQNVARSFAAHTTTQKDGMFATGDASSIPATSFVWRNAVISSYLYDDPYMRDFGSGLFEQGGSSPESIGVLTAPELLICAMKGTETKDYREGLDLVTYNGGYYQQIIARSSWSDDSPIVLLHGATSTTIDHSHNTAGEFQIYYKGALSYGDGIYSGFGTDHHYYYHQATIAHSCVLVFNPDLMRSDKGYYSGGQTTRPGIRPTNDYTYFFDQSYRNRMGEVLGVKYGYDSTGATKYVYYANDLTQGYSENVVDYVGRTILTAFPGGNYPMVLFIYDRIDVPETDYTKTFLLQCAKAPVLDTTNLTAVVDNGTGGRMVLKNLYGGADIAAYGSDDPKGEQRFWISTQNKNLLPEGKKDNTMPCWGKIEVRTPAGNRSDVMVNVVYVTDSTNNTMLETELLTGTGYYGAKAAGQTAIFAFGTDGTSYAEDAISFNATGTGTQDYYVGGLTAGTWNVMLGSQNLGDMTVVAGENVLVFSAEGTGNITVTPVSLVK